MLNDFRFAWRSLRRQPALLVTTVLLLGVGIGASSVLFSAVDALLLRPLPVRDPGELVRLVQTRPNLGIRSDFSYPFLSAARERLQAVHDVFAWEPMDVAFSPGGMPERIRAHIVTGNYFQALGVGAALGRTLEPGDDRPATANAAVLSHDFWLRRFGGDRSVLGRTIALQAHPFTVIGVLPASFTDVSIETSPDVRVPLSALGLLEPGIDPRRPFGLYGFSVAGRLQRGKTESQAGQEVATLYRAVLETESSKEAAFERQLDVRTGVEPMARGTSSLRQQFGTALLVLMGGVGILMTMVCANVAGLLLARASARSHEWAIRLAVGASRWRLARLLVAESVLLAACGIAVALAIALVAAPLVVTAIPPIRDLGATSLPLALRLHIDWRVLLFASALGVATAGLVSLAPALSAGREDLHAILKSTRAARAAGARSLVVALQVALCTLLLSAAGLLVKTFRELRNLDPGFDRDRIATFSVDPDLAAYTGVQSRALEKRLLEDVRTIPGVEMAAIASRGVMRGTGIKTTIARVGEQPSRADFMNASLNTVSPDYFACMGLRLLNGRIFREGEAAAAGEPKRVVVNQAFVERFCRDANPVGCRFGTKGDSEAIGVVGNAKYRSLREPVPPTVYSLWPATDLRTPAFMVHVRTRIRPEAVIAPVRAALERIDPRLPFFEITTLAEEVDRSVWRERMVAWISLSFAAIAALLAGTGLYGLMSYLVNQRSREIGIRAALGARPAQIVNLVSRRPLLLTLLGAGVGLAGAEFIVGALRPLLYGVVGLDAVAITGVAGLVAGVGVVSTLAPAVRAARIDPAATLRME